MDPLNLEFATFAGSDTKWDFVLLQAMRRKRFQAIDLNSENVGGSALFSSLW